MKRSNIFISGAAALVALVAVVSIAISNVVADDTSEKAPCFRHFWGQNLTDEEKAELQAQMEAKRAEQQAKSEAIKAALEANDYQAWVAAIGEDALILEKINESNFSKLVEAHEYMEQAKGIFTELGIERGKFGMGGIRGFKGHRGFNGINN